MRERERELILQYLQLMQSFAFRYHCFRARAVQRTAYVQSFSYFRVEQTLGKDVTHATFSGEIKLL